LAEEDEEEQAGPLAVASLKAVAGKRVVLNPAKASKLH
jgi:hypothetical protein